VNWFERECKCAECNIRLIAWCAVGVGGVALGVWLGWILTR